MAAADKALVDNIEDKARGNVLGGTGAGVGDQQDTLGADGATVSSAQGSKDAAAVVVNPQTGVATVTGEHGKLEIAADGSYTYTRNNDDPLNAIEVFSYTITDADGDSSTASIEITIADKTPAINDSTGQPPVYMPVDPNNPTSPSTPVIVTPGSVMESGLTGGSNEGQGTTITGVVTLVPGDGIDSITVTPPGSSTPVSVPLTPGAPSQKIETPYGEVTLTYKPDNGNGQPVIDYTYVLKHPVDDKNGSSSSSDRFVITVADTDADRSDAVTVVVNIVDDAPKANDDQAWVVNSTDPSTPSTATGNVLGGTGVGSGDHQDILGADGAKVTGVTSQDAAGNSSSVDADGTLTLQGKHGTLVVRPDGSYTYTRSDAAPLEASDRFTYTITDTDGDTSDATLAIVIADKAPEVTTPTVQVPVDPANPEGQKRPVIDGGTVTESGLPQGSQPGAGATSQGTIALTPGDGVATITVTPPGSGTPVTLTPEAPSQTVETPYGEVTLTYKPDNGNGQPVIDYTYVLKHPVDDKNSSTSTNDSFDITIADPDGDKAEVTVVVKIVDDAPQANDDQAWVVNSPDPSAPSTATGNVLGGTGVGSGDHQDILGADGAKVTGVTSQDAAGNSSSVDADGTLTLQGKHGTLVIRPDGSYTYTRSDAAPLEASDRFIYTITDTDGDTSDAMLTITIHDKQPGMTDSKGNLPTPVAPSESNPAPHPEITANGSVSESGLLGGSNEGQGASITDKIILVPSDGVSTVVVTPPGGQPVSLVPNQPVQVVVPQGVVTLTYKPGSGTNEPVVEYTYELKTPVNEREAEPNDRFNVTVTDADGDSSTVTVVVNITNDIPQAQDDVVTTLVGQRVTGQLGGNDVAGADGIVSWVLQTPPANGTISIDPDTGAYLYIPNEGFIGSDSLAYTITDADGDTSTATLTISVLNTPPVALDDAHVTTPGGTASGNVLTGGSDKDQADSDADGHPLTVTQITVDGQTYGIPTGDFALVHLPGKGILKVSSDGSYEFVPAPLWGGELPAISYTISDGYATSTAVLRITAIPGPNGGAVPYQPIWDVPNQWHATESYEPGETLTQGEAFPNPSVYWEHFLEARDMRLPELMHPITYVNEEVRLSQAQHRMQEMLGQWSTWFHSQSQLTSTSVNLGMDPALFVHQAVIASQSEARFWEFLASNMVLNLEAEAPAATPSQANALNEGVRPDGANTPVEPRTEPAVEDAHLLLQRWMLDEQQPVDTLAEAVAADSFHAQLIAQANALPSGDLLH